MASARLDRSGHASVRACTNTNTVGVFRGRVPNRGWPSHAHRVARVSAGTPANETLRRVRSDLLGLAEVATVLGVTKATAARRVAIPGFPRPVAELQQGALWSGREIVGWHADITDLGFHSQLSPYGPIPSVYSRGVLAIRITIEAQYGRDMPKRLAYSSVGDGHLGLLGLDLLQCLDMMEQPVWDMPERRAMRDHWARIPTSAKEKWRRTAELSIGVGTAPGVPNRRLIAHLGTDSASWSEDMWSQAAWRAHDVLLLAASRGCRDVKSFYPGGSYLAAVRDAADGVELFVDGVGEPLEASNARRGSDHALRLGTMTSIVDSG